MKRIALTISIFLLSVFSFAQNVGSMTVKTFTLSNGMEVWINEDHSQPKAFGAVVVKAGAKNCPGTGIAHYFEHMMFKGTEKIGTIDYAAEKPYLDSIAMMYDRLAEAPDSLRTDIQMEINRLNIAASEYAIPSEFDNLITDCGGSGLNAYTSQDVTVYHNEFISSYFEQWAELNSERLMDPVFRLFQSELETVYEEKNRAENNEMSAFSELINTKGFQGSPYAYPIIGTTANLKTPRLNEMTKFFNDYYVAGNMGLMLTGDIDADKALPVLEKTFGRIRAGKAPDAEAVTLTPYSGREEVVALAKIPLVKMTTLCYRGPSQKDPDFIPMSVLAFMLNNSEGIGMLDKLTTDKELMIAACLYPGTAFAEAGLFPVLIVPKLLFQSNRKAEQKVSAVLESLKKGEFEESYLESCKLTLRRQLIASLETNGERLDNMVSAYSQGFTWEQWYGQLDRINSITKEEIVSIVNKYISDDYLVITKKFGDPEKDNLQKPPYKKVVPPHTGSTSEYAVSFKESCKSVTLPKPVLDFETDAVQSCPTDLVRVYSVANKLNDVFQLDINYPVGTTEFPSLDNVCQYVNLLGTSSMTYEEHRKALQEIGGTVNVSCDKNEFTVSISGFDSNFEKTLALASGLLNDVKGDKSKLSVIREAEMTNKILGRRDAATIGTGLLHYVIFGDKSPELADRGKIDDATYLKTYGDVLSHECDIHYTGSLGHEDLVPTLGKYLQFEKSVQAHPFYSDVEPSLPEGPAVYFVNKKNATQSRIYAVVPGDVMSDIRTRYCSSASGDYFGGGSLGSVMFQEIREFRSMAYSAWAVYSKPKYYCRESAPGYMYAFLSTQNDKTEDAMQVLDSLICNVSFTQKRTDALVKNLWSDMVTKYPSFRGISSSISYDRRTGYENDPNAIFYEILETLTPKELESFWKDHVAGRSIIWVVVGDSKKLDMESLKAHGTFTELKPKDIIK